MRRGSPTGSTCVTPGGAGRGHTGASACRTLKLDTPGATVALSQVYYIAQCLTDREGRGKNVNSLK